MLSQAAMPNPTKMREKQAKVDEQDEDVEGADNLAGIGYRDTRRLRNRLAN